MERTAVRGRLTWQVARVTSVTPETDSVVTIELDPPEWLGHRAGQHLDLLDHDQPGFWENYGYNNYGDPWREQRYAGD